MTDIDHYAQAADDAADVLAIFPDDWNVAQMTAKGLLHALLAIADRLPLSDAQTAAGLRAEMEDRFASLTQRLELLEMRVANPEWSPGATVDDEAIRDEVDRLRRLLTEDEEGGDAAGNCEDAPGSPGSPSPASVGPQEVSGRENGAERCEYCGNSEHACATFQGRHPYLVCCANCTHAPATEPLTEEPPVGTQVVDSDSSGTLNPGDLLRVTADGYEYWSVEEKDWFESPLCDLVRPLRLATDADRERVGLPRDQWPSKPRTLGPDEIAVKVPPGADHWTPDDLQRCLAALRGQRFNLAADVFGGFIDALEAREGR